MKGIIMAGGEGSRLRPLTCDIPKPMVPVMDKPVMTYTVELLKKYGIVDIGVTLQYLPHVIRDYFGYGDEFGVNLNYFIEETPLGTAGSVKNAGDFLDETFIVISGDALTDINLKEAIDFHRKNKSKATLVLKRVEVPLEYGVVVTDKRGSIARFLEKPNWGEVFSDTVNTGIYILEPEVLEYFEPGVKFDFSQQLFPMLLEDGQPMFGYVADGYWCDIGNSETYITAHKDMLDGKVDFPIPGQEIKKGIWVGEGATIDKGTKLEAPCYISEYAKIGSNAEVGAYSVIGAHSIVDDSASIKRSILWNHVYMGKKTQVRGAILCDRVRLSDRSSVFEGGVIGEGCQLNTDTEVKPHVKIWPRKTIEEGSVVSSNVIWGTSQKRTLFGKDGIFGDVNYELDPYTISKLGSAFGAYLKPNKRVAVSTDHLKSNIMLKYALISGLLSTGLEVFDLGQLTTPILRYAVRHLGLDGGIHIFSATGNPSRGNIHILDERGCNLTVSAERKIENIFIRDDFQRQEGEDINKVHTMYDIPVFYIRHLFDGLDVEAINERKPKILISTKSRIGSYVLNTVLSESGCKVTRYVGDDIKSAAASLNYDLTCSVDLSCEGFSLYDENGSPIDKNHQRALLSLIYLKEKKGSRLVVPYTESSIMETMAERFNCTVKRTKSGKSTFMKEVFDNDIKDGQRKNKLFPLYFDGVAALIKIVELLSLEKKSLSEIVSSLPGLYMKQKAVKCPWSEKGRVMRSLIELETGGDQPVELYEGIRINYDNGWALVLPDSDEPVCRIYSEGFSEEYAEELATIYTDKIKKIIGKS